jgi:hypothetical protein
MKFHYAKTFNTEAEKMKQIDDFLEKLSEEYPIEFEKEIYKNGRFMAFGINTQGGIIYNPSGKMSPAIERQIRDKIKELWYSQSG